MWRVFSSDKRFLGIVTHMIVRGSAIIGITEYNNVLLATFDTEKQARAKLEEAMLEETMLEYDGFHNIHNFIYEF